MKTIFALILLLASFNIFGSEDIEPGIITKLDQLASICSLDINHSICVVYIGSIIDLTSFDHEMTDAITAQSIAEDIIDMRDSHPEIGDENAARVVYSAIIVRLYVP